MPDAVLGTWDTIEEQKCEQLLLLWSLDFIGGICQDNYPTNVKFQL